MTTNYFRGREIEYKCMEELREQDFYPIRSSGSKGLVDIVGVDINSIRLIQVKSKRDGTFSKYSHKDENLKKLIHLPTPTNCRKELWQWLRNKKAWRKDILTDY